MRDVLEQVGVGAGAGKVDYIILDAVHQEPVRLNVTFGTALVVAVKEMFMVTFRQGLPVGNEQMTKSILLMSIPRFPMSLYSFLTLFVCLTSNMA
jgi:hypothetical protein